jgi:hypothetical protein
VKGLVFFSRLSTLIARCTRSFTHAAGSRAGRTSSRPGEMKREHQCTDWGTVTCSLGTGTLHANVLIRESGAVPATVSRTVHTRRDTTLHYSGRVACRPLSGTGRSVVLRVRLGLFQRLLLSRARRRARRPACVRDENPDRHRRPFCFWGSLTANNLRDLRLVACLPLDAASLAPSVFSVSEGAIFRRISGAAARAS